MNLYQMLKAAGCDTDNHESDLYVEATDTARGIISEYQREQGHALMVTAFIHQVKRRYWLDIPFMFTPWWEARTGK